MTMTHEEQEAIHKRLIADENFISAIIERVAEKAADKAADKAVLKLEGVIFQTVGRTVIDKLAYLLGAIIVGGYLYLNNKGMIH